MTVADPLQALLDIGGLPGEPAEFCPFVGTPVEADGVDRVFGDVNCDGVADARDAIELIAELGGNGATTGACPEIGAGVSLTLLAGAFEIGEDWRDYGDAPDGKLTFYSSSAAIGSFPTSVATGPSHESPFLFRLGEFESAEETPRINDSADDGLLWLEMNECDTSSALVAISLSGIPEADRDELTVNIFGDWNRDGDWEDSDGCNDEWALQNFALDVSGEPDFTVLTVDFPGGDQVDEFWMRVMLTDQDYNPATDNLLPGETEDYLITGGQVFPPAEPEDEAQPASPVVGGAHHAGRQFLCQASVVPHGANDILFDIEQTTTSFKDGFRVRQIKATIPQPTTEDGKKAAGVTVSNTGVKIRKLDKNGRAIPKSDAVTDGRVRLELIVRVTTTEDPPARLIGPLILDLAIEGRQRDGKKFSGGRTCAFYIDHTAAAVEQGADLDGFFGGPGRAAGLGSDDPRFYFIQHGKTHVVISDAIDPDCSKLSGQAKTDCQKDITGARYDKSTVTVFGNDGMLIAPADYKSKAGIKSIKPSTNGKRAIKIRTAKDNHDPPVQRIVIRIMGNRPGGGTYWDYFRVVIVHERGSKANKLATDFLESGVAFFFDEDQATTIAYVADQQSLLMHDAPAFGALFEDVKLLCEGNVRHAFRGSLGFIQDYSGNPGSDLFYIPKELLDSANGGPCPPEVAMNITNFGSGSPFYILEAAGCFDKAVFSELNTESDTFRLGAVWWDGNGLAPVPGGDNYRDPSCFHYDDQMGIVGSTPGAEGRSNGGFVPLLPCNATCTEGAPSPKLILIADAPNVHMLGLAVSPDAMKIAWYRSAPGGSQVWIGDFDPATQTVSNETQLTTEGNNYDPTWSPHGDQLAFVSDRDGNFEIYVMDADGGNQTNITDTPAITETEPSWQVP